MGSIRLVCTVNSRKLEHGIREVSCWDPRCFTGMRIIMFQLDGFRFRRSAGFRIDDRFDSP